jgi:hypothetical protein
MKPDGNVILETDYMIVDGKKSLTGYWNYSYKPERDNFYIFATYVSGDCYAIIGSFTAENKWRQEGFEMFNRDKYLGKQEFVFDTPTSFISTRFNADGEKLGENTCTKVD